MPVVFAGHGALNMKTDVNRLHFKVPENMTIVFWVPHGSSFQGSELDKNEGYESIFGYAFLPQFRDVVKPLPAGSRAPIALPTDWTTHKPQVFRAGQTCYNYRLTPPTGLKLRPRPGDPNFIAVTNRGSENIGYLLKDLLVTYKALCTGTETHWAACRVVKDR